MPLPFIMFVFFFISVSIKFMCFNMIGTFAGFIEFGPEISGNDQRTKLLLSSNDLVLMSFFCHFFFYFIAQHENSLENLKKSLS